MLVKHHTILIFLFLAGMLSACQTQQRKAGLTQANQKPLEEAYLLFQQEKYKAALAKFSSYVYAPFPQKDQLASARYHMGLCHYFLHQFPEAAESMNILLQKHPQFDMAEEANEILTISRSKVQSAKQKQQTEALDLNHKIASLEDQIEQSPRSAQLHFQLGNHYWEAGEYQTAALHYEHAIQLNPEYEQNETVRGRVFYNNQNLLTPHDPVKKYQDADQVIRITNINHSVRTREDWLGRRESIRVSGAAENRSLRTVHNVAVEITLVDFFGEIQDSQLVRLGSIRPNETRSFSTLMNQFSGSANSNFRVKTQAIFDEQPER